MRNCFCRHRFLWGILILFVSTAFLICVDQFVFTKFPLAAVFQTAAVSTFPQSAIDSIFIDIWFKFHFQWYYFCFVLFLYCTFIFVGQCPLSVIHFCKISWFHHWETRSQAQVLALLSVHELITGMQWVITDRLWQKRHDWSQIKWPSVGSNLCPEKTGSGIGIWRRCSQLVYFGNWNVNLGYGWISGGK